MNHIKIHALHYLFLIFLSSCVSVNVGKNQIAKSEKINFLSPNNPFEEIKLESADHAWKSKTSGNTISFLSECNSDLDSSIKSLEQEFYNSIGSVQSIESKNEIFNGRESLFSSAEAVPEGIHIKIALLVFKKNNCQYTLSYVGKKKNFENELIYFEKFKNNFKVNQ